MYVCDYGNKRIQIFDIATLTYQAQHATQTVGGAAGSPSSIAINDTYYYVNCNNNYPENGYIEKYDIATRSFQAFYDTKVISAHEDVGWSCEIAKFTSSGTRYGDLWILHQDGSYLDTWPICRFVDDIRLIEDGDLATGDYVGLRAPATVTASYSLTFPAALPAGQSHVSCSASGILSFGQDVNITASPSFVRLTLTQATGTAPMTITSTTVVTNLNADLLGWNSQASLLGLDALADPGADRILFWDDSETLLKWLACGNSIAITATTLDTIQDIRTTATPTFGHVYIATTYGVSPNTADGSDNAMIRIGGGGDDAYTRGGYIRLYGDDYAATGLRGNVDIAAGYDAAAADSSSIRFATNNAIRGVFDKVGNFLITATAAGANAVSNIVLYNGQRHRRLRLIVFRCTRRTSLPGTPLRTLCWRAAKKFLLETMAIMSTGSLWAAGPWPLTTSPTSTPPPRMMETS
ncbi:MAG: hypothetical protein MZV49_24270 [Rhodopseudomonas palustris]|nr:hypothetical protein [Rhodopseudomonas palustris]